ncbi:tRNA (N6-threonylcarbamoyladenosine(37)-N6)-methyltransferase TrmO [Agarivorans sp. 1_MG-2023]|uniref:tRNA (N6-threonylcarbamoyladenosine(37)-N6)-methyltransferase TrmO n=1 Tax=Agarivorans sp. 1_MG-2023 TaxID=3062634 RepID=UPI0026E2DECF|nr:tRNA (N6-threonylcarbamoyladenosine(37)-N6)-methyltransferase TrmO [Agarivorans sp. 1_MG-2023]MDO6765004.1 tRNA (N6-threonylcarbamoyladenosine(37)-N6)-methyltransferase TrmO [Agarivorans sp. 1_MG-2023]
MTLTIEPLGHIHSPYQEKFSVPRQANLVTATSSKLVLCEPFNDLDMLAEIEQFSHLWLIFAFHQNIAAGWKAKVRPPRLGGNKKVGVLASRSSFRPNHLGLSLMELSHVERDTKSPTLHFRGGDLVNGTPIYDVKPYLPYSDSKPDALAGYAQQAPSVLLPVSFSPQANQQSQALALSDQQYRVIEQVLAQDPRPAYKQHKADDKEYGVALFDLNIRWKVGINPQGQQYITVMSVSYAT